MTQNFHETSYRLHTEHTREKAGTRKQTDTLPSVIASPESIDAFRHERMYEFLRPLVDTFPLGSWMTVGDTGADAYWMRKLGVREITATSLSCEEIMMLKERGYLNTVHSKNINAECIDFPDNSFDFILCKETFHHLPRAPIAFYELLRVCRQAVIYIEPAETIGVRLLDRLRDYTKLLLRKQAIAEQLFESSGNFIYRLSEKEIRKQSIAMQLDTIAFKYFNDFYYSKLSKKQKTQNLATLMFKLGVSIQNLLCAIKLMSFGLIVLIVFKRKIHTEIDAALTQVGYDVEYLPKNPFI